MKKRSREGPGSGFIDFGRFEGFRKGILKGKMGAVNLRKSGPPSTPGAGTYGTKTTMKKRSRTSGQTNLSTNRPQKTMKKTLW